MIVRNGVWGRIKPQFSETQRAAIEFLMQPVPGKPDSMDIRESGLKPWLVEKIRNAISKIEVGA